MDSVNWQKDDWRVGGNWTHAAKASNRLMKRRGTLSAEYEPNLGDSDSDSPFLSPAFSLFIPFVHPQEASILVTLHSPSYCVLKGNPKCVFVWLEQEGTCNFC